MHAFFRKFVDTKVNMRETGFMGHYIFFFISRFLFLILFFFFSAIQYTQPVNLVLIVALCRGVCVLCFLSVCRHCEPLK